MLFDETAQPDRDAILAMLAGDRCRCIGYTTVELTAGRLTGPGAAFVGRARE